MTPLLSWLLLLAVGTLGALFALAFARWLDDGDRREWQRSVDEWERMCAELDLTDWKDADD